MNTSVGIGGRFGNSFFLNMMAHFISSKYNLKFEYNNSSQFQRLGIELYQGTETYTQTVEITDNNFLDFITSFHPAVNIKLNSNLTCQTKDFCLYLREEMKNKIDKIDKIKSCNIYSERYQDNNDLYVHVRLGDIEGSFSHDFEYYDQIIGEKKFNRGYISSDTINSNICQKLITKYNLEVIDKDEVETIMFASTCKYIVLSDGTYSWLIGFLGFYSNIYYPAYGIKPKRHGDIFVFEDWNEIKYKAFNYQDNYIFIPSKDYPGFDLYHYQNKSPKELMKISDNDPNCMGFNTSGYFKNEIDILSLIDSKYSSTDGGIYIKKKVDSRGNEFIFIPGLDQYQNDIYHRNGSVLELMDIAYKDPTCVGFNTFGFFKNKIYHLAPFKNGHSNGGIYIKKSILNIKTENDCKYVSSRGILKSCDIHSYIPISSISNLVGYDFSGLKDGSTVYICSLAIRQLKNFFDNIPCKVILVTGDCDESCPDDIFNDQNEFKKFINDDKIIHWYSQNATIIHPKLTQIPIGLDYHTMANSDHNTGKKTSVMKQEYDLINLNKPHLKDRKIMCYSNFHFLMTTKYGNDRIEAKKLIPKDLVYYEPERITRLESWNKQVEYAFVISPHGNGLDCHRTWEALCLGCIPIVKTSKLNSLFDNLPVLIVNEWSDITQKLLNTTVDNYINNWDKFDLQKLTLKYWMDKIKGRKGRKGREKRAVFTTCVKNVENDFIPVMDVILKLSELFIDYRIIIIEDGSTDNTIKKIKEIKEINDKDKEIKEIIHFTNNLTVNNPGMSKSMKLSIQRNKGLELIWKYNLTDFDYYIPFDINYAIGEMDGFSKAIECINSESVCSIFPYNIPYYDEFALVHNDGNDGNMWDYIQHDRFNGKTEFVYGNEKQIQLRNEGNKNEEIEVKSAFGGIGIYKMKYAKYCKYNALNVICNHKEKRNCCLLDTCEHIAFNESMRLFSGEKLIIHKNWTIKRRYKKE